LTERYLAGKAFLNFKAPAQCFCVAGQVPIIKRTVMCVSTVIDYFWMLPEIYAEGDRKQKGRILNEIAQRINVNPQGIEIIWNEKYRLLLDVVETCQDPHGSEMIHHAPPVAPTIRDSTRLS
jgi:hypothetical protein